MQFEVDPRSPVSPSEQLSDQVRFALASGRLDVGDRLPSVREIARSVAINPNTVSRAWRELELADVLVSQRGRGMFVAEGAVELCREFRTRVVAERLGRAVGEALAAGLSDEEALDLVRAACGAWRAQMGTEGADVAPSGAPSRRGSPAKESR